MSALAKEHHRAPCPRVSRKAREDVRVLPLVAQLGPIRRAGGRTPPQRVKQEEACARALQAEILEPEIVHRMDRDPIQGMHRGERKEGAQREPERSCSKRREDQQQQQQDQADGFGGAADGKARIVDRLDGEIFVLRQPHLSGQLERVGKRKRHRDCHDQDG
jgi:hypothetical protein